jgi:hypothetical protein
MGQESKNKYRARNFSPFKLHIIPPDRRPAKADHVSPQGFGLLAHEIIPTLGRVDVAAGLTNSIGLAQEILDRLDRHPQADPIDAKEKQILVGKQ